MVERTVGMKTPIRCVPALLLISLPAQAYSLLPAEPVELSDIWYESLVEVGDFNGDGRDDVVSCYGGIRIIVQLQDAAGKLATSADLPLWLPFQPDPPRLYFPTSSDCRVVAVADLDGTGTDDIVIVHRAGVTTLRSHGEGFDRHELALWDEASDSGSLLSGALLEANGDGTPDLIGLGFDGSVTLWRGDEDRVWLEGSLVAQAGWPAQMGSISLNTGDLDSDGKQDIVLAGTDPESDPLLSESLVQWFSNRGDGTFEHRQLIALPEGPRIQDFDIGDVTNDGRDDVVAGDMSDNPQRGLLVFEQLDEGGLGDYEAHYTYAPFPETPLVADFDGDGLEDISISHPGWRYVSHYRQTSDGLVFVDIVSLWNDYGFQRDATVGDLDSDGCIDLVKPMYGGFQVLRGSECVASNPGMSVDEAIFRGSWYNPWNPGQGISADVVDLGGGRKVLFLGWYTYERYNHGRQLWFVAQAESAFRLNPDSGYVEQPMNLFVAPEGVGRFNSPPTVGAEHVGTAIVQLISGKQMRLRFRFNGTFGYWDQYGEVVISKLPDLEPVKGRLYDLQGSWYDTSTSGQGIEIDVLARAAGERTLFATWYTYAEATGDRMWLVLSGAVDDTDVEHDLQVFVATGGNFIRPPAVEAQPVGTARLRQVSSASLEVDVKFDDPADPRWHDTSLRVSKITPPDE